MRAFDLLVASGLASLASSLAIRQEGYSNGQCEPWTVDKKQRIFVLTDINNEPDDTMSLVRLMAHSDLYTIEGIVSITSFWLPNGTYEEMIQEVVDAYGTVRDNLQSHSNYTFPTAEYLSSKIAAGPPVYGMEAIKQLEAGGELPTGVKLLIDTVDASDEPLYVQVWGGSNTVASALWYVNRTRTVDELNSFTSKIRVYSISDQDDTGIWARRNFPDMRWIASRHGFNQYGSATWLAISSKGIDLGGPNLDVISDEWIAENLQIGGLGKMYPDVKYIMEGDSPSLLYNIPNGLGNPEHPSWGSWGGRYTADPSTNFATIWRWRVAFQDEFASRMQWTLAPYGANSSTTHPPIVVVNNSCGSSALEYNVNVGDRIILDASSSYSPDANANLNFTWFQYREPSSYQSSPAVVPSFNITSVPGSNGRTVEFVIPAPLQSSYCVLPQDVTLFGSKGEMTKCPTLHVVVAVKDDASEHPITRYRRALLHVQHL